MFSHKKLEVHAKALNFASQASTWTASWDKKDALVDQLDGAGTSIVLNIAEGTGRYDELDHQRLVQAAQGATVKAAALLDLCFARGISSEPEAATGKDLLLSGF